MTIKNGWETQSDGTKCHYVNGKLHREDGPAIEYADGSVSYYFNGNPHRMDGPAKIHNSGHGVETYWVIHGELVPVNSQKEFEKYLIYLPFK
jgi:hypothetical protein